MMYMGVDISYFIIDYLIAIFSSIVVSLMLRLPLLPEKPYIFSFFVVLNYLFAYNGMLVALIIGVCSALFVKYLFFYVFPKPPAEESEEVLLNE